MSGYFDADGAGMAGYDQTLAGAFDHLRAADSFVVVTAVMDDVEPDGIHVEVCSFIRTPFPPHFLAIVSKTVAEQIMRSIEDLAELE